MNFVPPGLVLAGVAILLVALLPACRICRDARQTIKGWRGLLILIVGFIVGYIAYDISLIGRELDPVDYIVSSVFFLGAVFVYLVSRLSMATIREMQRVTALERHRAAHDDLTGLPNRCSFAERIGTLVREDLKQHGTGRFSVILMDVDRFKMINDTLGHEYGDALLREVTNRLRGVVQGSHTLARLGGDEFGVVIEGLAGPRRIADISARIHHVLEKPFQIEGHAMDVEISIGVAIYPEHGRDATALMKRAEIAMYAAKKSASNFALYRDDMEQHSLRHLSLLGELRNAIESDQLDLVFHPQVDVHRGALSGVEALIRWPRNNGEVVQPDDFVPLAEQAGMIVQLDRWVLARVAAYLRTWKQDSIDLKVSVNISAKSLSDPDFLQDVLQNFTGADIAPTALVLEITESAVMADPELALKAITRLTQMGIGFSIDDFGTGYSSLAYLKRLPATEIKIDKSFVTDMGVDDNDAVIVRSTIDLAHNMGRRVVAEGVEDRETLELLAILGCDHAQGFFISKPMRAADLLDWMRNSPFGVRAVRGCVAPAVA